MLHTAHYVLAIIALILAIASLIWPGKNLSKVVLLLLAIALLVGCQGGKYIGPSLTVGGTYNGIGVTATLLQTPPTPTPAPTPVPVVVVSSK